MMNEKILYEDYKYSMQDTACIYIGSKYTLEEITTSEEILFKLRKIFAESIITSEGVSKEDTLESHLYYLSPQSFVVQIYKQMKARVRVSMIQEKKHLLGGKKKEYTTKYLTIEELVAMSKEEKETCGLVIQELKISKLNLVTI